MIGDYYIKSKTEIVLRCEHGFFVGRNIVDGRELYFSSVSGFLVSVGHEKAFGFDYSFLRFRDESSCFVVYCTRNNASFRDSIVLLHQQGDNVLHDELTLEIESIPNKNRWNVITLRDSLLKRLETHGVYKIPHVLRVKENGKRWYDYTNIQKYIDTLCTDVNSRITTNLAF